SPWVPKRYAHRPIPHKFGMRTLQTSYRLLGRLETFVKPRMTWMRSAAGTRIYVGILYLVSGLLLALPFPIPFSNSLPALTILTASLGLLEQDGLMLIISTAFFVATLVFFLAIFAGPAIGFANLSSL